MDLAQGPRRLVRLRQAGEVPAPAWARSSRRQRLPDQGQVAMQHRRRVPQRRSSRTRRPTSSTAPPRSRCWTTRRRTAAATSPATSSASPRARRTPRRAWELIKYLTTNTDAIVKLAQRAEEPADDARGDGVARPRGRRRTSRPSSTSFNHPDTSTTPRERVGCRLPAALLRLRRQVSAGRRAGPRRGPGGCRQADRRPAGTGPGPESDGHHRRPAARRRARWVRVRCGRRSACGARTAPSPPSC